MDIDEEELKSLCDEKIAIGKTLNEKLNVYKNVPGVLKIQKKITAEMSSLQNVTHNY